MDGAIDFQLLLTWTDKMNIKALNGSMRENNKPSQRQQYKPVVHQ